MADKRISFPKKSAFSAGQPWMRMDPKQAQAAQTRQFLEDREATRRERNFDTMGLGTLATGLDIAGGIPQYLVGEAAAAAGVDPVGLLMSGAEAVGAKPEYGLAAGGLLLGSRALRKAGKAAAKEATAGKALLTKPPSQMSDAELTALGERVGVNLRPSPMLPVKDPVTGREYLIPGGLEQPFSYTDLHQLKAQAYDPNMMSAEFQAQIQKRMLEATTPKNLDKFEVLNRTMFGMQSPNTPLGQNMFLTARMRARTEDDIEKLAGYTKGKKLDRAGRRQAEEQMSADYQIGAASKGGLGVRSSVDNTNVSELAAKVQENPEAFIKRPNQTWLQFVERMSNQLRGLSAKTGSFASVWQAPADANISAIDRHMARKFLPDLLDDPDLGPRFRKGTVAAYNRTGPKKKAKKFEDVPEDFKLEQIETQVNTPAAGGKWEVKGGLLNPRVPEHLQDLPYRGGDTFQTVGPIYQKMLDTNAERAKDHGLSLFGEQWRLWDRIRASLEPHEVMYPGLHKLPALSLEDMAQAKKVHSSAGFFGTGKRKPYDWREGLYWSAPTVGLLGASAAADPSQTPPEHTPPQY